MTSTNPDSDHRSDGCHHDNDNDDSNNKRAKIIDGDLDEFDQLRRHILDCPFLEKSSVAIKAALDGLDKERKRIERDIKLKQKFTTVSKSDHLHQQASGTSSAPAAASASASASNASSILVEGAVMVESSDTPADLDETSDMQDWQDVDSKEDDSSHGDGASTSYLGKKLAKLCVDSLARHGAQVRSPVAAIAAIIHASMRTDDLGFACTGVPDDPKVKSTGFAAPIRELPASQLFPPKWDTNHNKIMLRYRKKGFGSVILCVEQDTNGSSSNSSSSSNGGKNKNDINVHAASTNVTIQLSPTSSQEPPREPLMFALDEHVNLSSWNVAKASNTYVQPALHYKALSALLTKYTRAFDLGSLPGEEMETEIGTPYMDATIAHSTAPANTATGGLRNLMHPSTGPAITVVKSDYAPQHVTTVPNTIQQAFPLDNRRRDFADDLAPAGLMRPGFDVGPNMPGGMGGNLMGPNHPMFMGGGGGFGSNMPMRGGPGTMQPRYDPFGPPGGPQDPRRNGDGNPSNRRQMPGEPNPDHLRPPNTFGDSMFS